MRGWRGDTGLRSRLVFYKKKRFIFDFGRCISNQIRRERCHLWTEIWFPGVIDLVIIDYSINDKWLWFNPIPCPSAMSYKEPLSIHLFNNKWTWWIGRPVNLNDRHHCKIIAISGKWNWSSVKQCHSKESLTPMCQLYTILPLSSLGSLMTFVNEDTGPVQKRVNTSPEARYSRPSAGSQLTLHRVLRECVRENVQSG